MDASTSLADILAMDSPLEVSTKAYEAPPTRFGEMPFGGWDGQQGSLDIRRAEEPAKKKTCLLYTSPSPRDRTRSRMPSSA